MTIDNASHGDRPDGFFYLLELSRRETFFSLALVSTADLEILREVEVCVTARDRPLVDQAESNLRVLPGALALVTGIEALLQVIYVEVGEGEVIQFLEEFESRLVAP